jgi:uncharacterized protein (TIGR02217 family)
MSAFHDVRLPIEIEVGANGGPQYQTTIVTLSTGDETRNADWSRPLSRWSVGYGTMANVDYSEIVAFFHARRGRWAAFRFRDWTDYKATLEALGNGNGTKRTFLLVKTYTSGGESLVRRITRPDTDTLRVFVNGVESFDWDYVEGGAIKFTPGNAPGAVPVTYTCQFDVPVRFATDQLQLTVDGGLDIPAEIAFELQEVTDKINAAPEVSLANTTTTLAENVSTAARTKMADIIIDDDAWGSNELTLGGADAASFEIDSDVLYLKAGVALNYETKNSYVVIVEVDDARVGTDPDDTVTHTLTITDANDPFTASLTTIVANFADGTSNAAPINVATVVVTDDALGTEVITLTGADAASFSMSGFTLRLVTGGTLVEATKSTYNVTVHITDGTTTVDLPFLVTVGVIPSIDNSADACGADSYLVPEYNTLVIELWGAGAGGFGALTLGTAAPATAGTAGGTTQIASLSLVAGGGQPSSGPYGLNGGLGGTPTGGDVNTPGEAGASGTLFVYNGSAGGPAGLNIGTGPSGRGGASPNGGLGGGPVSVAATTGAVLDGNDGVYPGGGGSGAAMGTPIQQGGTVFGVGVSGGGGGSYVKKTYVKGVTAGYPVPGATLTLAIGCKGIGGNSFADGGDGANGRIRFTVT